MAHAVPTRQVLASFEPITADNRRIILQEWLAEAFTMWGIAAVVIAATVVPGTATDIRAWVYRAAAALLIALGTLTALDWRPHPRGLVQDLPRAARRLSPPAADRELSVRAASPDQV